MVTRIEPLHFYQSKAGEICMVILATNDEVLYVSYESDVPGLVEELTRDEFAAQHDREVPCPYSLAAQTSRSLH